MHLHLHPTRHEALTASDTALTRWSLGTQVSDEVGQVRDIVRFLLSYLSRWIASVVPLPLTWPHHCRYHQAIHQLERVVQRIITERRAHPTERGERLEPAASRPGCR